MKKIWENRTPEEKKKIGNKISKTKKENEVAKGKNNPMFGRSVVKEKNLKWYTNGIENKYITEGTEPDGFYRGRTNLNGKIGRKQHV